MKTFYLGTHQVNWVKETDTPLMISVSRTKMLKKLYPAIGKIMVDSIGFTMLSTHGKWIMSENEYLDECYRVYDSFGTVELISPQDWMCEPFIIEKTGLSVREHQEKTIENYLSLTSKAPKLPFLPVLQGYTIDEYLTCLALYRSAGVKTMYFGLGSVCRRQDTDDIDEIVSILYEMGLKLHAYGVKLGGLQLYGDKIDSADSLAWSLDARYKAPLPNHTHKNCANCLEYALQWYARYTN